MLLMAVLGILSDWQSLGYLGRIAIRWPVFRAGRVFQLTPKEPLMGWAPWVRVEEVLAILIDGHAFF